MLLSIDKYILLLICHMEIVNVYYIVYQVDINAKQKEYNLKCGNDTCQMTIFT